MPEDDPKQPDLTPEEPSGAPAQSDPEAETTVNEPGASELESSETAPDQAAAGPEGEPEGEVGTPEAPTVAPAAQVTAQPATAQPGVWDQAKPILKKQSIRVLRGTIWLLEKTVDALEAEPQPKPAPASRDRTATTSALGRQTTPSPVPSPMTPASPTGEAQPASSPSEVIPEARRSEPEDDTLKPLPARLWEIWVAILNLIRSYIPGGLANRIPNPILTGILAAIAIFLLSTINSLFSPSPAPKLADKPAPAPTVQVSPAPSPSSKVQPSEPPIAIAPSPEPTQAPTLTPKPKPKASPKASPKLGPTPTPSPSPELELTPEQSLIAAIQDQVAEVSDRYANGLIQSVQANFRDSRLMVRTSPSWYDLVGERQDQLANELLQRAKELDFSKLEILDPTDELVARSPVVGSRMVILLRSQLTTPASASSRSSVD